jgi:hypothetical protein
MGEFGNCQIGAMEYGNCMGSVLQEEELSMGKMAKLIYKLGDIYCKYLCLMVHFSEWPNPLIQH